MNQIKKYAKNDKNKKPVDKGNSTDEMRQLGILVLVIVVILLVIYLTAMLFKKKDYSSIFDNSLDVSEVQYDEIIVGTMLNQDRDSYYVLVLDKDDPYYDIFKNYISTYNSKDYEEKIYIVELNNIFNKEAKVEEADVYNLKFNGNALLKIKNHKIKDVYLSADEIGSKIIEMTKDLEDKEEA